jgi:signal transduction histidine kinase
VEELLQKQGKNISLKIDIQCKTVLNSVTNLSVNTRRLLIGGFIGIFSFTFLTLIDKASWQGLEKQILESRSIFSFNARDDKSYILSFDKNSESKFESESEESQKEYLVNLIKILSQEGVLSVSFALSNLSRDRIDDLDLILNLNDYGVPVSFLQNEKIISETVLKNELKWLNRSQLSPQEHSIEEFLSGKLPSSHLLDKNILIKTGITNNPELKEKIKLWLNQINSNWLSYLGLSPLFLLVFISTFGAACTSVIYTGRILLFFGSALLYLLIGQIFFSVFQIHLETVPFLATSTLTFLLSNLFDLNYKFLDLDLRKYFKKNTFSLPEENKSPNDTITIKALNQVSQEKFRNEKIKDFDEQELRRKFYCEQENYLESLALAIQENTIQALVGIEDRLSELEDSELNEKQTRSLGIIKYDFNKVIDELDAILFNLSPFQFELEKGLIDSFILLSQKINYLSRGKIRVNIQTKIISLKLDKDIKINVYRIIERLLDLIKYYKRLEPKIESLNNLTNVVINIQTGIGEDLIIKIHHDGTRLDKEITDYRLKEIFQRCKCIKASLELGQNLNNQDQSLINRIELKVPSKIYSTLS